MGNLARLFAALRQRLTSDGKFLFSVERCESGELFRLETSGRFSYSRIYLNAIATRYDMQIIFHQSASIRKEEEKWIRGDLYLLQRSIPE